MEMRSAFGCAKPLEMNIPKCCFVPKEQMSKQSVASCHQQHPRRGSCAATRGVQALVAAASMVIMCAACVSAKPVSCQCAAISPLSLELSEEQH